MMKFDLLQLMTNHFLERDKELMSLRGKAEHEKLMDLMEQNRKNYELVLSAISEYMLHFTNLNGGDTFE